MFHIACTYKVVLCLTAEAYQSVGERNKRRTELSLLPSSEKQGARARSRSLADADARSVEILLEPQVVLGEPAELELAHALFPWAVHHAGLEAAQRSKVNVASVCVQRETTWPLLN